MRVLLVVVGTLGLFMQGQNAVAANEEAQQRPVAMECLSSNRDGVRVVGNGIDFRNAFEESLYQCYLHSEEFSVRSCRVNACREHGKRIWKRVF